MANSTLWFLKWLAAGFGSGWLPKAPGTWGSLASLIPAYFILVQFSLSGLWWATLMVSIIGFIVCYFVLPVLVASGEDHDPGWIVIDEWAGQWLCIALLLSFAPPIELIYMLPIAFVLFRGFDIIKPFPIKTVETWGADWFSIMNDDLVAGFIGAWLGILILWGIV
ncbi:MAG: phosphatidylglycerophosphatase A [Ghiorsea sp.]